MCRPSQLPSPGFPGRRALCGRGSLDGDRHVVGSDLAIFARYLVLDVIRPRKAGAGQVEHHLSRGLQTRAPGNLVGCEHGFSHCQDARLWSFDDTDRRQR